MTDHVTGRFDWYQATIREVPDDVSAVLLAEFPGAWLEPASVRLGYGEGLSVRDSEGRRANLQFGGHNTWPNVTGSGQDAPAVADLLRGMFPDHEVTRVDSARDYDEEGGWARLRAVALKVADRHRIQAQEIADPRPGSDAGATLYLGSKKSPFRARIYEKGKERQARGALDRSGLTLNTVRVEAQVRPRDGARTKAAAMTPDQVWGFARWGRDLYERVTGLGMPEVHVRDVRESNDRRALRFMVKQYGAMLERQATTRGGYDSLWRYVERLLADREAGELR